MSKRTIKDLQRLVTNRDHLIFTIGKAVATLEQSKSTEIKQPLGQPIPPTYLTITSSQAETLGKELLEWLRTDLDIHIKVIGKG